MCPVPTYCRTLKSALIVALLAGVLTANARADAVTEWNKRACDIVVASGLLPPPASRVLAISHTAAFEAANTITRRYPAIASTAGEQRLEVPTGASVEAAIAAAHHASLLRLLPAQEPAIEAAYRGALSAIADSAAKQAGLAVGQRAALAVLARRADDGSIALDSYRPATSPGRYVPTVLPAGSQWAQRRPWLMDSASKLRPQAPYALSSERWARDYNEVKAQGGVHSTHRSADQTEVARFWEMTTPAIFHGIARSVAEAPGRDLMRNARLFAALTQASDDSMIAVFDAKYHHAFWRPVTAIRNGDADSNDATDRDASWLPMISTPMHPEYPCAHCTQAAVFAGVLEREVAGGAAPKLTTTSVTAGGASRQWSSLQAFVQEVGDARVWGGIHFRLSTEVGLDMGRQLAALAVQRFAGE